MSCSWIDLAKPSVLRVKRLIRVRNIKCFRSKADWAP